MSSVVSTAGANTIEFIRTGPSPAGTSYYIAFDYVLLGGGCGGNTARSYSVGTVAVNELNPLTLNLATSDTDSTAAELVYELISGPVGWRSPQQGRDLDAHRGRRDPAPRCRGACVTDAGVPRMSATNSFTITVNELEYGADHRHHLQQHV